MNVAAGQRVILGNLNAAAKRATALISIRAETPLGEAVDSRDLSNVVLLAGRPCSFLAPVGLSGLLAFGTDALDGSGWRLSAGGHDKESG